MIHVLIVLECVLLMIIGLDKVITLPAPKQVVEKSALGFEAESEAPTGAMRSGIVPVAAAAGPQSASPVPLEGGAHSVLFVPPPGADALLQPEWPDTDALASGFGAGAMREIDRLAIARELLGSVVDDRVSFTEPAEIIANTPTADVAVPLPRPTKASRPKTSLAYMAPAQPAARPGQHAHLNSNEVVPAPKSKTAIRGEAPGEGAPATAEIAEVQRLLTRLGYQIGDIDGVFGKRTELAIRSFQQRRGTGVDGRISGTLIAQLRRAATRNQRAETAQARQPGYSVPRRSENAGWFTSVVAGYQRLVGHDFNSISRPRELQSYCRRQTDTWVYDEASGRLLHCGQVIASK